MKNEMEIGKLVEVTGPDAYDRRDWIGERFRIERTTGEYATYYTAYHVPLFLASSLRLVPEELKIGDFVEIIGQPPGRAFEHKTGQIDRIIRKSCDGFDLEKEGRWYLPDALRKLNPEEIQQHEKGTLSIEDRLIAIEAEIRYNRIEHHAKKHSAIEERLSAIEKRHQEDIEYIKDNYSHAIGDLDEFYTKELNKMQKSIDVLESIQRGEGPEVCECKMSQAPGKIGVVYVEGDDCKPPEGQISITIQGGKNEVHGISYSKCPAECLEWCEKVLDSMREG